MSEPIVIPADDSPVVSRRNLRHLIVRRRNERIAESRDERWPLTIYCHRETLEELLVDGDPNERHTLEHNLGGPSLFMGLPLVALYTDDAAVAPGEFHVVWPTDGPAGRATEPSPVAEGSDG